MGKHGEKGEQAARRRANIIYAVCNLPLSGIFYCEVVAWSARVSHRLQNRHGSLACTWLLFSATNIQHRPLPTGHQKRSKKKGGGDVLSGRWMQQKWIKARECKRHSIFNIKPEHVYWGEYHKIEHIFFNQKKAANICWVLEKQGRLGALLHVVCSLCSWCFDARESRPQSRLSTTALCHFKQN